jgi:hypothetical protein
MRIAALRERVPRNLMESTGGVPPLALIGQLTKRL